MSRKPVVSKVGVEKFGTQAATSIKCRFFRNGDKHHNGVEVVLDPKKFNDLTKLRQHLDKVVSLPTGPVLSIKTPKGTTISKLEQMKEGKDYFAVGGEGKVNMENFPLILKAKPKPTQSVEEGDGSSSQSRGPVVQGSLGKEKYGVQEEKAVIIYLFKNGDKHDKGSELKVHSKVFKTFDQVLEKASVLVKCDTGPVRKIFTPSGKVVKSITAFKDGRQYICAGGEPLNTESLAANAHIVKE